MVSQAIAKKGMKMIREIKDIAKAKFPRTKWTRDGVGGLTSSSPPAGVGMKSSGTIGGMSIL